jgi:hypothetical protein
MDKEHGVAKERIVRQILEKLIVGVVNEAEKMLMD